MQETVAFNEVLDLTIVDSALQHAWSASKIWLGVYCNVLKASDEAT